MTQQQVRSRTLACQTARNSRGLWNRETQGRHRDYSPTLGRFIERDPIGFETGDNNWYRFVANGPTGKTDPSGLDWLDDITDNKFYRWLYTGDPNIDTVKYRQCCEPAGKYVTCHITCMADVNKQLIAVAAGGVGAGANARDVFPFPKWIAKQLGFRVSGQNWFTSIARLKSTHPERFCIPRAEREAWKELANQIKSRPGSPGTQVREIVRRGARGGIGSAAVLEILISLYCIDTCN